MDKAFSHKDHEASVNTLWETNNAFSPDHPALDQKKEPFTILLPPPNANASLHAGHAMFVIEDILIRWKRMQGHPTVWIPGTDHAGFETQYVYEKQLAKSKQSRFDFDRKTLYSQIAAFVQENSGRIIEQLKLLGFSCDWSRLTYMLDEHVVSTVYKTFQQLIKDGLVYRDMYLVNYRPKYGTTFSELETIHVQKVDPLYYYTYGPFTIATVRPETMFGDTAIAVNPKDKRYAKWIGKTVRVNRLIDEVNLPVIGDPEIDMEFGTGVMKVTPAHDPHDFQLGRANKLPIVSVIDQRGKVDLTAWLSQENLTPEQKERLERYHGKKASVSRELVASDLEAEGLMVKVDTSYTHNVVVSYKGNAEIEPLVMPNWFIKMKPLAEKAISAAKKKEVQFIPARFEKEYYRWLENIRDWPVSRQIVWGIRIPVWYSAKENPHLFVSFIDKQKERQHGTISDLLKTASLQEILSGLQELRAPVDAKYIVSVESPGKEYLPETDTFDTWFSSGQWPLTTLHYPDGADYKRFYPTSVLDTMWDILFFWVARMIMFGLHMTGEVPFKHVYLHSMVTDAKGQKMSKSKGNVVNPIEVVDQYGADALRMSLVAGSTPGNPIALSMDKVKGYRNFANKVWNIGRYLIMKKPEESKLFVRGFEIHPIMKKYDILHKSVTKSLEIFRFSDAALAIYDFLWNDFANGYLEERRDAIDSPLVFETHRLIFVHCLKMLHPFMPFVTEAVWQELVKEGLVKEKLLAVARWE
jgi:valyl-tRNA synthetase